MKDKNAVTWRALTAGVCNQAYYWQLIMHGWTPDFDNNRAVVWTWQRMIDRTRIVYACKR